MEGVSVPIDGAAVDAVFAGDLPGICPVEKFFFDGVALRMAADGAASFMRCHARFLGRLRWRAPRFGPAAALLFWRCGIGSRGGISGKGQLIGKGHHLVGDAHAESFGEYAVQRSFDIGSLFRRRVTWVRDAFAFNMVIFHFFLTSGLEASTRGEWDNCPKGQKRAGFSTPRPKIK